MWWVPLMLPHCLMCWAVGGATGAVGTTQCRDAIALQVRGGIPSWTTVPLVTCPHAPAMHAIQLIVQGDLHAARKVLKTVDIDWVAEQYLGAAAERIARTMYASGAGDDRIPLGAAARHLQRALEGQESSSPHAALAQPLTITG